MKKIGDVHPLVTILGVIVGLGLFGFMGFIFGPFVAFLPDPYDQDLHQ